MNIMHRESDESIIDALRENRGLVARLVLALRVLFSVPKCPTSAPVRQI
jgi:hypothetical protein